MKKYFVILALLLGLAQPAHAQFSRIIQIRLINNDDSVAAVYNGPFTIKMGADCDNWSIMGTVATLNCSGGIGGTFATTQITFGTATDTLGGDAQFTWDNTGKKQTIGTALTLPSSTGLDSIAALTDAFQVSRVTADNHAAGSVIGQGVVGGDSATGMYIDGVSLGSEAGGTGAAIEGYEGPGMGETVSSGNAGAGVFAAHGNYGIGTVQLSAAFRGFSTNLSTGTITSAISFLGQTATNPGIGTITNAYTFYGQPQTAGTTANFTYFSESGQNFFRSPNFGNCQALFCLSGDGYGDSDNFGTPALLDINQSDNGNFAIVFRNTASASADIYSSMFQSSTGNFGFYNTADNVTYSGFSINPVTQTFLFDGGGALSYPKAPRYNTIDNCADAAGAAACGSAAAGVVVIDAGATTVTVSTTAVGNATGHLSRVFVQETPSASSELGITCNATLARTYAVTTITDETSFVIASSAAPITNPACLSYWVVN